MKKYSLKITVILFLFATVLTSCGKDFLNWDQTTAIGEELAFEKPADLGTAMTGAYYTLGRYEFWGRNAFIVGDIAGDIINKRAGTALHMEEYERFNIVVNTATLSDIWTRGYQVVNRASTVIDKGKEMSGKFSSSADQSTINTAMAQAYGLKAWSTFVMVNMFAYPYQDATAAAANQGIIAVDHAVTTAENVSRVSVAQTYTRILEDIQGAKDCFAKGNKLAGTTATTKFYMNLAAVYALEARVRLYMKDYANAITAANNAITESGATIEMDPDTYVSMWKSSSASKEDIFTFLIDGTNQLSANSINTYYNVYGGSINPASLSTYFAAGDMRLGLFVKHTLTGAGDTSMWRPMKLPDITAISNIPVFRVPEMYLIIAEAQCELNQIVPAQTALLQTAKRNPAITAVGDLPSDQATLRQFIKDERVRELFQEGHRFWDIRRNGDLMTRPAGETKLDITSWDAAKFCYPIPFSEVNVPGTNVVQTDGWNSNMPN